MSDSTATTRQPIGVITAHRQLEGAGFAVYRPFPTTGLEMVDPFLMLDEKEPKTYAPGEAKGAPDHPHRGFETVSYVLDGETEHADSLGNRGIIRAGDVQWMTAGDGIVHSEMPSQRIQQEGGRTHGFQLWVNLPAHAKRTRPRYQSITADQIPKVQGDRWRATVIAGHLLGADGPAATHTPIVYAHLRVEAGGEVTLDIPDDHQIALYVFGGSMTASGTTVVDEHQMAVFAPGPGPVTVHGTADRVAEPTEVLVMAGRPLGEPVARYGPFVMNTRDELITAMEDYQTGRMGTIAPAGA